MKTIITTMAILALIIVMVGLSPVSGTACRKEIIITSEKLIDQAEKLKQIHEDLGIHSEIVTVEDIWNNYSAAEDPPVEGYATGEHYEVVSYNHTLAKKIISFLRNCSSEYVTIFGDADVVPPSYYTHTLWREDAPTDYFYADPDYDMHAERAVGRLPVSDADEAAKVVSKIETWYNESDENTFSKAVLVGTSMGGTYGLDPTNPHLGQKYVEDIEAWRGELGAMLLSEHLKGFDTMLYMQSDVGKDGLISVLDDAFSGGYGAVFHFGHGTAIGPDAGGKIYRTDYLTKIQKRSGSLLPLMASIGCKIAAYDNELISEDSSINKYELYNGHTFSEMLLLNDAGGIALAGFTRSSVTDYLENSSHVTQQGYVNNGFVSIDSIVNDSRFGGYLIMKFADGLGTGRTLGEAFRDALNAYVNASVGPTFLMLEFELLGDPTLQIPALEQKNISRPRITVESQPVSIETPEVWYNGLRYYEGAVPKFVGSVKFLFDEPVVAKVFNLTDHSVEIVQKVVNTTNLTFSQEGSGKYLLRASNGKRETWYVFYFEPGERSLEISYPEQVEAEVGRGVNVQINANVEDAECVLVSAPEGARCENLVFTWIPGSVGNCTVEFVVSSGNQSVNGSFVIVVHPPGINPVHPVNSITGVELDPELKISVNVSENCTAEFYTDSGVLIGSDSLENGYATVQWRNLEPGKTYGWYATLKCGSYEATSDIFKFRTSFVPGANFEYSVDGNTVVFTSTSTDADGQQLTCIWDFGDGSKGYGCEITHEFAPGNYSVTLTVVDTTNLTDSITKPVNITFASQSQAGTSGDLDGDGLKEDVDGDGALKTTKNVHHHRTIHLTNRQGGVEHFVWSEMLPDKVEVMKITNEEIGLTEIIIQVKNPANSVKIKITKLSGKPASVVHEVSGKVYAYIEISKENLEDENIAKAEIKFRVEKSWLESNNLDKSTVVLNRYEEGSGWVPLPTEIVSEDSNFVYYKATTPGFSYFAISAQEKTEAAPPTEEVTPKKEEVTEKPAEESLPAEEAPETPPTPPVKPIEPWMVTVGVLMGVLLVLLIGRKFSNQKLKENFETSY